MPPDDLQRRRFEAQKIELNRLTTPLLFILLDMVDFNHAHLPVVASILEDRLKAGVDPALEPRVRETVNAIKQGTWQQRNPPLMHQPVIIDPEAGDLRLRDEAEETFRANLPRLLIERPNQWVAYHGSRLIGFARTDIELVRLCKKLKIPRGEYVVHPIEEPMDEIDFTHVPIV
jgi:hypothetical protein